MAIGFFNLCWFRPVPPRSAFGCSFFSSFRPRSTGRPGPGMVATIGMIVPDLFGRFGGDLSPSMGLTLGRQKEKRRKGRAVMHRRFASDKPGN